MEKEEPKTFAEEIIKIMERDIDLTYERMAKLSEENLKVERKYLRTFYWSSILLYVGLCSTLLLFDLYRALSWYYYWLGFSVIFLLSMIWRQIYFNGRAAHYRDEVDKVQRKYVKDVKDHVKQ